MLKGQIAYKNSTIAFSRFGTGSTPVLCFHGYGESAMAFSFLEQAAGDRFCFYALDLPFHGETEWNEGLDFNATDLVDIVDLILSTSPVPNNEKAILLGFSLGGRMALSLFESSSQHFQRLVLLAPDGLRVNPWYRFATKTRIGKALFRYTMKHPGWFFALLNLCHFLHLVNPSVQKFVQQYVGNASRRKLLYRRWVGLRLIRPNLRPVRKKIRTTDTHVSLVYGKHDRIILPKRGKTFITGIEDLSDLVVIDCGHQVLHPHNSHSILNALQHSPGIA